MLKVKTSGIKDKRLRERFTPRIDAITKFSTQLFYISEEDLPEVGDRVTLDVKVPVGKEQEGLKWLQYYISKAFDLGGIVRPWCSEPYQVYNLNPDIAHKKNAIPLGSIKLFNDGPLKDTKYFLVPVCIEPLYGAIREEQDSSRLINHTVYNELLFRDLPKESLAGSVENGEFVAGTGGAIVELGDNNGQLTGGLLIGPVRFELSEHGVSSKAKPLTSLVVAVPDLGDVGATDEGKTFGSRRDWISPISFTGEQASARKAWSNIATGVRDYLHNSNILTNTYPGLVGIADQYAAALTKMIDTAQEVNGNKIVKVIIPIKPGKIKIESMVLTRSDCGGFPDLFKKQSLVRPINFKYTLDIAKPLLSADNLTDYNGTESLDESLVLGNAMVGKSSDIFRLESVFSPDGSFSLVNEVNVTINGRTAKSVCSLCPKAGKCGLENHTNHNIGCLGTVELYKTILEQLNKGKA